MINYFRSKEFNAYSILYYKYKQIVLYMYLVSTIHRIYVYITVQLNVTEPVFPDTARLA